jgi:4-amino-4-deoxy-L-arabinose transferase-like glycosyltransferase
VFSLARTKLPNYITPAYPAAALLTACYVYHLSRGTALSSRRWAGFGATAMGVMGLAILVGMPVAASIFLPGKEWLGAVGLILLAGAGASWMLFRRGRLQAATCVYAAAALTFAAVLFGFAAPEADEGRVELQLLDTIAARSPDARILTYGPLEPSWTFYAGRPIPELGTSDPAELAAELTRTADTYLITTEQRYETLQPDLPPELTVLDRRPRFLRPGQMVLVGQYGPGTWLEPRVAARPSRER